MLPTILVVNILIKFIIHTYLQHKLGNVQYITYAGEKRGKSQNFQNKL